MVGAYHSVELEGSGALLLVRAFQVSSLPAKRIPLGVSSDFRRRHEHPPHERDGNVIAWQRNP